MGWNRREVFALGLAIAALSAAPKLASAQFTTFIPPAPRADTVKVMTAAQVKASADSIAHAQITDMKTWVDSVASASGVATPPAMADTAAGEVFPAQPAVVTTPVAPVTGTTVVAPATASDVPALFIVGLLMLSAGIAVEAQGRRPARE